MDLPPLIITHEYVEVPEVFWSDASTGRFENCLVCERYLLEDGTRYLIEKAFRSYRGFESRDTVFEYAMCEECRLQMQEEMSAESRERVDQFFTDHVDFVERRKKLLASGDLQSKPWLDRCLITGEPTSDMEEYQVYCECDGAHMLYSYLPYAVSGAAIDQIVALLSNPTIDSLRGFVDRHLGVPPEFEDIFAKRVVLI